MPIDDTLHPEHRRLTAIMFTDIVGFGTHTQRDEAAALEMLKEHQGLVRTQLEHFHGREVKSTGDGFMVDFPSALEAARCAVEIQRAIFERNATLPPDRHFLIRIGVHVGDVVFRGEDMFGDGVNVAARIEPLAAPGGVCITGPVVDQIGNKLGLPLRSLGTPSLKHVDVAIKVYSVTLPWELPAHTSPKPAQSRINPLMSNRRTTWLALAAVMVVGGFGWNSWNSRLKPGVKPSPGKQSTTPLDLKRLLVLPFKNDGGDQSDSYFADGLTRDLITWLSRLGGLKVVDSSTSFLYKGHSPTMAELANKHNVGSVLEGEVSRSGGKARVSVRLIDVADGTYRWSADFDPEKANLLDVRTRIAQEVTSQLKVKLVGEEHLSLARRPTNNPDAYKLYIQGRARWSEFTEDGFRASIAYYEEAIKKDSRYALAYAGIADSWIQLADGEWARPKDAMAKAKDYALMALSINPQLPEAFVSLGTIKIFYDRDWPGAEKDFQTALKLDPTNPDAYHFYGHYLEAMGRTDEAIESFRHGLRWTRSPQYSVVSWPGVTTRPGNTTRLSPRQIPLSLRTLSTHGQRPSFQAR